MTQAYKYLRTATPKSHRKERLLSARRAVVHSVGPATQGLGESHTKTFQEPSVRPISASPSIPLGAHQDLQGREHQEYPSACLPTSLSSPDPIS